MEDLLMIKPLIHHGLPKDMDRWSLMKSIEQARHYLQLSKGAVSYLKFAIEKSCDQDFLPFRISAFWYSVTEIASRCNLDRRQVSRIEAELVDKQLIHKTCADHTRRYGKRENGVIIFENGINIAPLIQKAFKIKNAALGALNQFEDAKKLRTLITALFGKIRRFNNNDALFEAESILPNRRPSTVQCYERLKQIFKDLECVYLKFKNNSRSDEMSHQCDISPLPYTEDNNKYKKNSTVEKNNKISITRSFQNNLYQVISVLSGGLRESVEDYWKACGKQDISWSFLSRVIWFYAQSMGLKRNLWERLCSEIGEIQTALCFVIADRNAERTDRFQVKKPIAAFYGLARKQSKDETALELFLSELSSHVQS